MFALHQRKTVLNQPGARLMKKWPTTGERRKKNKSKTQTNGRPFSAFHTPTLDSLCSLICFLCVLMAMLFAQSISPTTSNEYNNTKTTKEGGLKRKKAQTCLEA